MPTALQVILFLDEIGSTPATERRTHDEVHRVNDERRWSVMEELKSVVTANLQRATRLRQSILNRAFSGKL
ncbi:MAG: hypothetical protein RL514_2432 [Verrucomicrobiota bacterium]|jgi:hypothetical protein